MRWLTCLLLPALSGCASKRAPQEVPSVGSAESSPAKGSAGLSPDALRDKILGVNAHVLVMKRQVYFGEYRDVLAIVEQTPGVVAAEPFIFLETMVATAAKGPMPLALKAVDPARVGRVLALASTLKVGKLESLATGAPPSIILGDLFAKDLAVGVGDTVIVNMLPTGRQPGESAAHDAQPRSIKVRVTGIFHVGFEEYDEQLAYICIDTAQALIGQGDQVMGVEATVRDLAASEAIAEDIERALGGPPYMVEDWYELNEELFRTVYGDRRP